MLQISLQNDTLLKQLHQAVETKSHGTTPADRKLIQSDTSGLSHVTKQQPVKNQETPGKTFNIERKTIFSKQNADLQLDSIIPISAAQVELSEETLPQGLILPERPMFHERPDWVVGVFILALVLLATVRLFFNKYLNQLFHAVTNYSTSLRLFRERSVSLTHASFRLDLIFYFVFSIFVFQLFDHYQVAFQQPDFVTYLFILGIVTGYFALKRVVYFFTAILSESTSETSEFLYNMNIHNRVLGLFLIPVTLIIAFSSLQNPQMVVFTGLLICGGFYVLLLIRGAKILMTKHFSIFYLILYLCTLEILPLIFIYKMVLV